MDKTQLLKLYLEKPASEIARDHNLRPSQIQTLLRFYGIPKPYRNKEGRALDINLIWDLYYNQKKSLKDISISMNASIDMVTNILYKDVSNPEPSFEDISLCLKENLSKKQIALKYHIKEYEVLKLMLKYKLCVNPFTISKELLQKEYATLPIPQLAKKYQVDRIYISMRLKEYGLISKTNIEDLKRLYCDERKTIKEITAVLNISETTLWRLIKKHKLQRPFNPKPQEFSKLWHNNTRKVSENIKWMAEFYKVSISTIRLTAKKLKINKKTTPIKIKYTPEQFKEMYEKHGLFGLSIILKMSESNVRRALSRHGVAITPTPAKELDLGVVTQLYKTKYLNLKMEFAVKEIAKELEVKPTPLHRFIRKHKITR